MVEDRWFYVDPHRQKVGPVSAATIADCVIAGTLPVDTNVWSEGLTTWEPASEVEAIRCLLPPPLPQPPATTPGPKPAPTTNTVSFQRIWVGSAWIIAVLTLVVLGAEKVRKFGAELRTGVDPPRALLRFVISAGIDLGIAVVANALTLAVVVAAAVYVVRRSLPGRSGEAPFGAPGAGTPARSRVFGLRAGLVTALLALAASCVYLTVQYAARPAPPKLFGADPTTLSKNDINVLIGLPDLTGRWNRAAAPFVRDYADPNVPADRWVREASRHVAELRAVAMDLRVQAFLVENPALRATLIPVAENYNRKLGCVIELHNAVARGDAHAEQQANRDLAEAGAEGQKLALAMFDGMRPYLESPSVREALKASGKEVNDLMKPHN